MTAAGAWAPVVAGLCVPWVIAALSSMAAAPVQAQVRATPRVPEETWGVRLERGDTLIGLKARYMRPESSWRVVQRLNRIADPHRLRPGSTLRIPVALLREEAANAEVLHVHGEVWVERTGAARQPLAAAATLLAGDAVVTGAQSSVSLRFADGSRTQLGPQGRLVLDRHVRLGASGGVDTRVRLEAGPAETLVPPPEPAQRARPAPRFELRTPVVSLGVRGTEFRSRVDGERTLAEVVQGRVAAGAPGAGTPSAAHTLEAGFGTVATAAGVAPPRPLLPAPDLAGMPGRVERVPLRLPLPAAAAGQRLRVQIYDAADVPRLLLEGLFEPPQAAWPDDLLDGRYEMRVRVADADGVEGQAARRPFVLRARPEPPFLLRPRAGEKLTGEQVTLAWARNPAAASYKLQVAPSPDFAAPTLTRDDLDNTEVRLPLALGTHHWRVASVRANGEAGPWGDAQSFERVEQPPPPPAPSAPGGQSSRAAGDGITVNWAATPLPGASYQVQIARDAAFSQLVLDERTPRNEVLLAKPEPGTYHVRVRTIGADGRPGPYGGAQLIEVPRSSLWWLWLLPLLLLF